MKKLISIAIIGSVLLSSITTFGAVGDNPYDDYQHLYNQYFPEIISDEVEPSFTGGEKYREFALNYNFSDVSGNNKKAATLMAALSITKGIGRSLYGGSNPITNLQSVIMLVRSKGAEEDVIKSVKDKNSDIPLSKLRGELYDAYIAKAKELGIIGVDESIDYYGITDRETFASMLFGANSFQKFKQTDRLKSARDYKSIDADNVDAVSALVDSEVMNLYSDNTFKPNNPLTRSDMALYMDRAMNSFADELGIKKHYALVQGIVTNKEKNTRDILVKNSVGDVVNISLQDKTGFPYFDGKNLLTSDVLTIGEQFEYLTRDGKVFFASKLSDNQVKRMMVENYLSEKDVSIVQGTVLSNTSDVYKNDSAHRVRTVLRTRLDDDKKVDFIEEMDVKNNIKSDFPIMSGSGFIPLTSIGKKQKITVYLKNDKVLFMLIGSQGLNSLKGTIKNVDLKSKPNKITVFKFSGGAVTYDISPSTDYYVNYYKASISDMKPGLPVNIISIRGILKTVLASSYQPQAGYIPENSRIEMGNVKRIIYNTIYFNQDDFIDVYEDVKILKNGKPIELSDIKVGDSLKLYYSDIYTTIPSKIVVEGKLSMVDSVLKATLSSYVGSTNKITLKNIYKLEGRDWVKLNGYYERSYPLAKKSEIYYNRDEVQPNTLRKKLLDKEVYVVLRDNFGKKEAVKVLPKKGFEKNVSSVMKSHNNIMGRMKLSDNMKIYYGDDTIFLMNNRLVDKLNLSDYQNLIVISNGDKGLNEAKIVNIDQSFHNAFSGFVIGQIGDVNQYSISLDNYFDLGFNMDYVSHFNDKKTIFTSDESVFYDFTKGKPVSRRKLFNGEYDKKIIYKTKTSRRENSYYGVFWLDDYDHVISAGIRNKEFIKNKNIDDTVNTDAKFIEKINTQLNDLKFVKGRISEFDKDWNRVGLKNSYQWQEFNSNWDLNTSTVQLYLKDALIIKNSKPATYNDLRTGDMIYAISNDEKTIAIYVEE